MFKIKLCKNKGAYEVKPEKNIKLNLDKLKKSFKTIVDTPILLVIEKSGQIVIHDYGKLVFKDLKNEKEIRKIANEIYKKAL